MTLLVNLRLSTGDQFAPKVVAQWCVPSQYGTHHWATAERFKQQYSSLNLAAVQTQRGDGPSFSGP